MKIKSKRKRRGQKNGNQTTKLITVRELAKMLNVESSLLLKNLWMMELWQNINQELEKKYQQKLRKARI